MITIFSSEEKLTAICEIKSLKNVVFNNCFLIFVL